MESARGRLELALDALGLCARDLGATNRNESGEVIYNQCFYLSLARLSSRVRDRRLAQPLPREVARWRRRAPFSATRASRPPRWSARQRSTLSASSRRPCCGCEPQQRGERGRGG